MLIFALFGGINAVLTIYKKKIHAPSVLNIHKLAMCYFTSNLVMLTGLGAAMISGTHIPQWQAIMLGAMIVILTTTGLSDLFYGNENIETKKSIKSELSKMSKVQAREYLYDRLPDDEAEALWWLDFHGKPLEFVAFNKIDVSASTLKCLRRSAYERLRHINKSLDE